MDLRTDPLTLGPEISRLVVLGDPHGDLGAYEAVRAREATRATAFASTGDNIGYADGPSCARLCERLRDDAVASVYGNHEAWLGEDGRMAIVLEGSPQLSSEATTYSRSLPLRICARFAARPALRVTIVHTIVPADEPHRWAYVSAENIDALLGIEADADVIFVGHSHGPAIYCAGATRRLELGDDTPLVHTLRPGERVVVDAGSLGRPGHHPEPGRFDRASYAVLDASAGRIELRSIEK